MKCTVRLSKQEQIESAFLYSMQTVGSNFTKPTPWIFVNSIGSPLSFAAVLNDLNVSIRISNFTRQ